MRKLKIALLFHLYAASRALDTTRSWPEKAELQTVVALSYPDLHWRLSAFRPSSIRAAVAELHRDGYLITTTSRGTRVQLTSAGVQLLHHRFPPIAPQTHWDGLWRIALLSQPTPNSTKYRKLRHILSGAGFGTLERGVYLAPRAPSEGVMAELQNNGLMGSITFLEAKGMMGGDQWVLARRLWALGALLKGYGQISSHSKRLISLLEYKEGLIIQSKESFQNLFTKVLLWLEQDPGLPVELYPEVLPRLQSFNLFLDAVALIIDRERTL